MKKKYITIRTSLVLLLLIIGGSVQAQNVDLNDPSWALVQETFEVVNNGSGTDRFEHWRQFDVSGNAIDDIFYWIKGSPTAFTTPISNMHNYALVASITVIPRGASTPVTGRRVDLTASMAPLDLSRVLFRYIGVDANQFIFNNSILGAGGDPTDIPAIWANAFGFHTDEEGDETGSTTNGTGTIPVHWRPGTTTPTTSADVAMIDQTADTNNDGQLTILEFKNHINGLGYININKIFETTQSFGDFLTSNNISNVPINTTPFAETDVIPSGDFNLYVTLLDTSGKEISSGYGAWVVGTVNLTPPPDTTPPTAVCQNITVPLNGSGVATIVASQLDGGSSDNVTAANNLVFSASQTAFSCSNVGTPVSVTLTVTDQAGNSSTCIATVTVVDNLNPQVITQNIAVFLNALGNVTIAPAEVNNGSSDNCGVASTTLDITNFTCANLGANTVTLTVTDVNGNSASAPATVTVVDNLAPTMVTQNTTVILDASGNAAITVAEIDNGSSDNCAINSLNLDITAFSCANVGVNTVTLTGTDASGNSASATATVTVVDNIAPVAATQNLTVQLDGTGNVTIAAVAVNNNSTDNCGIANYTLDVSAFDCSNIGANTITLTVTDGSGNSDTETAIITVEDTMPPQAITQNITVPLDASGTATITVADVDNGSDDNCGLASSSIDITTFTCANLGANTVTLTVTDVNGNSATATAIVTVVDNSAPTILTQNINVPLDASGNATITTTDIDSGSTDNCTLVALSLDITTFTCAAIGTNTVTLTGTDQSGNTASATATVTIVDTIAPIADAMDITIMLDTNGQATITTAQVDLSTDNCSFTSTLDISSFDCNDLGANTVTLTVTDAGGNTATTTFVVTVIDDMDPEALGMDITRDLAGNPSVTIVAADVDNGSTDNCSFSLSIDQDTFTAIGQYPVVLTVTDASGNSATANVIVTIIDSLGTADNEFDFGIKLYPQPAKDVVNYQTEIFVDSIKIFDIRGRLIEHIHNPQGTIGVSALPTAIYFLKFHTDQGNFTKRMIKE